MKRIISYCLCLALLASSTLPLVGCKKDKDKDNDDKDNTSNTVIYDMLTEDAVDPIGIDNTKPVFSWKVNSDLRGWLQSAYKITVKNGDAVVWDSGKVESSDSIGIAYAGDALKSSTKYAWQVTVWDTKGTEYVSDTATFEMGLLGKNAFSDTKWISNSSLFTDTTYTIDFDFVINSGNQGFCFAMENSGTFVMWQVSTYEGGGKVLLRPHFKSGGSWTAYPGGPGNVSAVDITSAIGYDAASLIGKTVHERIEVDGKVVKTYFGADANNLTLASTYTHSSDLKLSNIGFRHSSESGSAIEVATYDNIVIKDKDGNILYENDYSGDAELSGSSNYEIVNGALKVGSTTNMGEHIFTHSFSNSLPVFRKEFSTEKNLVSAKLYTSGLGVYESYINGKRVGRLLDDGSIEYYELKPGFTEMSDRKFYSSFDVTHMIDQGKSNVLSATVSPSWWSDLCARNYGTEDAYLAKLILTYSDGTVTTIVTDTSWKTSDASPVIYADIFTGETYDARIKTDWMYSGFDDSSWRSAKVNTEFKGTICAWIGSPITVRDDLELSVVSTTVFNGITGASSTQYGKIKVKDTYNDGSFTLKKGETAVIDFGQNFAGWEAFTVEGAAGTTVTIEHGEILNDNNGLKSRGNDGPEGTVYNANYRSAQATTRYILSGEGKESYHPGFTFYGFRYLQITADDTVTFHSIAGQVVTSVEKETGFIETSDKDINQLISNIRWGQYSNYLSVPTDCPQRDERQGWTADTQVFSEAGCYLAFSKSFLEKFLTDLRDSQASDGSYPGTTPTGEYNGGGWGGFGWADAGIIVPYNLYMMYGDKSVISDNWDSMKKYVDKYLGSTNKNGGQPIWGDWLAYESNDDTIKAMLAVAFYAWDALLMAEMAEAIGRDKDAEKYMELYETEKEYFISKYVKGNGKLARSEQSVCLYALYLDLLPDEDSYDAVVSQLVTNIKKNGNKLQTGFLGTAIIMPTLTKIGRSDVAYSLLLQHDNPSWLYSVDQGATTIWERWNSYTIEGGFGDVGMNSFNHYAYGAVAAWMFDSMAGINYDTDQPGYKRIIFAPQPDDRIDTTASYDSAYGLISAKSTVNGANWTYECSLPANTTAEVQLPIGDSGSCTVNGKDISKLTIETDGIEYVQTIDGIAYFEAVSGTYTFEAVIAD